MAEMATDNQPESCKGENGIEASFEGLAVSDGMGAMGEAAAVDGVPAEQMGRPGNPGAMQGHGGGGNVKARGQNTQVFTADGDIFVRLHQTNIVSIRANGDVNLSSGGWRTHQTLKGVNTALKAFAPGLQVVSDGHVTEGAWRITNGRDWSTPFYDGVTVPAAAPQNLAAQAAHMPGLFDQMLANAGASFENGYPAAGGDGNTGGRSGGGGRGGGRGRNPRQAHAGKGHAGGHGNHHHQSQRMPLHSAPLPKTEDAPTNFEAYDDIPVEASGEDCPPPAEQFSELGLHPQLLRNIEHAKFLRPTPVQRHAVPVGLARRDLMACAQTGSGKTGAFLFPVLHQLMAELEKSGPPPNYGRAEPRCLILAPTRELATQIFREAQRFVQRSPVQPVVVYGGAEIRMQMSQLDKGCTLLVATPGRLCDLIERGKVSLAKIAHLVMDEADRMLDMGFEPQIRRVVERENMPQTGERQTLMFSATFPKEIQKLASEFMTRYIFVAVGRVGSTTALITQSVLFVEENDKRRMLLELLHANHGRTIIFVETKRSAEQIEDFLYRSGMPATSIHGDRSQREREHALHSFRRGQPAVLVATDVAARGLDVPDCLHVINYELPRDINSYVHRIGRTGRMGRQGMATSLYSPTNRPVARDLVSLLEEAMQVVPEWLRLQAESGGGGGNRGYNGRGKFGGRDYRSGAQVRQYRHSASGTSYGQPMSALPFPGNAYQQQQAGYLAGMQHKQPGMGGMYGQAGVPGVPGVGVGAEPNGWAGYHQMNLAGMPPQQISPGAYQQQMPGGGSAQRGTGAAPGWMGMQAAQAQFGAAYYGQQAAQGGSEGNGGAMMAPMGMMWPQQQQMTPGPAQQEAQFSGQQPYAM